MEEETLVKKKGLRRTFLSFLLRKTVWRVFLSTDLTVNCENIPKGLLVNFPFQDSLDPRPITLTESPFSTERLKRSSTGIDNLSRPVVHGWVPVRISYTGTK